jgi:hypothetical protein
MMPAGPWVAKVNARVVCTVLIDDSNSDSLACVLFVVR